MNASEKSDFARLIYMIMEFQQNLSQFYYEAKLWNKLIYKFGPLIITVLLILPYSQGDMYDAMYLFISAIRNPLLVRNSAQIKV